MTTSFPPGSSSPAKAALSGLKVVEFAQLVAGPLAGTLLGDLGADVIHVEDPGRGDSGRRTGMAKDGTYLWWKVLGRNKRSVTLDLRKPEGQEIARQLVAWADVVITNLRPGTLDSWNLNWESLHALNPRLVMLQVSGYGDVTTLRNAPGYGKVGEARSGVVHITGFPDGPPVHTGFSHADTVTALMGAFAVQAAVYRQATDPEFDGEWIDLAIDETLFRLIEWQVVHFDQLGIIAERIGNGIPGAPGAVVNAFQSAEGRWITVTSGTLRSIQNIAVLVGMPVELFASEELVGAAPARARAAPGRLDGAAIHRGMPDGDGTGGCRRRPDHERRRHRGRPDLCGARQHRHGAGPRLRPAAHAGGHPPPAQSPRRHLANRAQPGPAQRRGLRRGAQALG